jgi:nucleotide-binding universal stress UspA family protein
MFRTIVVPLDGSPCAAQAIDVALKLAQTEPADLAFCCVVDPIFVVGTTPPSPALDLMLADRENEARHTLRQAIEKAESCGVKARGEVTLGVPFDEILRFAKREKAGAIVMGTHGRTGIKRFLFGSVTESVLRQADCPVIVVREAARVEHVKQNRAQAAPA